jgi:hypothetical protein
VKKIDKRRRGGEGLRALDGGGRSGEGRRDVHNSELPFVASGGRTLAEKII